jgi:hypothetical protein
MEFLIIYDPLPYQRPHSTSVQFINDFLCCMLHVYFMKMTQFTHLRCDKGSVFREGKDAAPQKVENKKKVKIFFYFRSSAKQIRTAVHWKLSL